MLTHYQRQGKPWAIIPRVFGISNPNRTGAALSQKRSKYAGGTPAVPGGLGR
jgi:hypothetical protein